jgi:hypothetical protein
MKHSIWMIALCLCAEAQDLRQAIHRGAAHCHLITRHAKVWLESLKGASIRVSNRS